MEDSKTIELTDWQTIHTGLEAIALDTDGIQDHPYVYDGYSIMQLEKLPPNIVIIGSGYLGLEFASMYTASGSKVTVLVNSARLLEYEDEDISQSVRKTLEMKGVSFQFNVKIKSIRNIRKGAYVCYTGIDGNESGIKARAVLLTTGRKPHSSGPYPDSTVKPTWKRTVIADSYTDNLVVGKEKGAPSVFFPMHDFRVIHDGISGTGNFIKKGHDLRMYCMFTDPPLSHVGLHEDEARMKGYDIRVNRINAIPQETTLGKTGGMLKAIIDLTTDQILGCTLFCFQSDEIINMIALAIQSGQKSSSLRDMVFTSSSIHSVFHDLFR